MPAATTVYSGINRFTVRPSAEIGRRKGSAAITSSGSASGRRRISSASAAIASAAPSAISAMTVGLGLVARRGAAVAGSPGPGPFTASPA